MKRTVLVFGLILGLISSVLMVSTVSSLHNPGNDKAFIVYYTAIVASFLLVFFGIRSYRDNVGGGQITFGRAFSVGILITLISCVFYVVTWEIVYFNFLPGFMDSYWAHAIEKVKASGKSAADIQAQIEALRKSQASYENPLINSAMTFIEPFPVG